MKELTLEEITENRIREIVREEIENYMKPKTSHCIVDYISEDVHNHVHGTVKSSR